MLNDYVIAAPAPALQVKAASSERVQLETQQLEEGDEAEAKDKAVKERIAAVIDGSAVDSTEGMTEIEKFRLRQAKRDRFN